jgi:hypothetical protein
MRDPLLISLLVVTICLGIIYHKMKIENFMTFYNMRVLFPAHGMPYPDQYGKFIDTTYYGQGPMPGDPNVCDMMVRIDKYGRPVDCRGNLLRDE